MNNFLNQISRPENLREDLEEWKKILEDAQDELEWAEEIVVSSRARAAEAQRKVSILESALLVTSRPELGSSPSPPTASRRINPTALSTFADNWNPPNPAFYTGK